LLSEFLLNKALIAAVAVLGIAVAGCSSSGAGSPATPSGGSSASTPAHSTATAAATSPSAASPVPTPPGKAALAKIVVQQADLPAGWAASPHESDPSDAASQAAFLRCAGGRDTQSDRVAEVDSPDFDQDDASVMSSATSFKSQSAVEADVAILKSAKASACYQQVGKAEFARSLPSGAKLDAMSFKITPAPASAPSNVVAIGRGTVTVTASGERVVLYLAVAFIADRFVEAEVDIESPGEPIPDDMLTSLAGAVAARAAQP
jgi:hypothetical protein